MYRFPDGAHVWLRSRARRAYLYADEDGVGVSLSPSRASLNAAWTVHRVVRGDTTYVLLRSAAYGRYLALSPGLAPNGHRGRGAIQCNYSEPGQVNIMWRAITALQGNNDVLLRHVLNGERYLRANGRYRHWNTCVTVDGIHGAESTMMHWTVEHIPPRPAPPALPTPAADLGDRTGLLRWRAGPVMERVRAIWYSQVENQGNVVVEPFPFLGRSVFNLTYQVAFRVNEVNISAIMLCVRAGQHGRLTPLVIDLPDSEERLDIAVVRTGSPAAAEFQHPNVDAPVPAPSPLPASAP